MADAPRASGTGVDDDDRSPPRAPRWVKVLAVLAVLALAMIAIMLLAGGDHGPSRHTGSIEQSTVAGLTG